MVPDAATVRRGPSVTASTVRPASWVASAAGADVASTPVATREVVRIRRMMRSLRIDWPGRGERPPDRRARAAPRGTNAGPSEGEELHTLGGVRPRVPRRTLGPSLIDRPEEP